MFRKMPIILLAIILLLWLLNPWISTDFQAILYGISVTIKSIIVLILPFVIFGLLFKTSVQFANKTISNKAPKIMFLILGAVCFSNFFSTMLSYGVGSIVYRFDLSLSFPSDGGALLPAWEFAFPKWIGNDHAMFSGLIFGVILGWLRPSLAMQISGKLEKVIHWILRGIILVIPFFVAGFVAKMFHDQVMTYIFSNYSLIFVWIASALFVYIAFLYFVVNRGSGRAAINCIKNMMPAGIAGFGSMSSAAAMPLTLLGVEKNSKNRVLACSVIPVTVNIHLIGDCFAIPIFAFAVMKSFGVADPSFMSYLIFACYFVLAKFSVAAVPGGGILVMLPILETYLGFNAEMLSLITALYILFDPVITSANVLGNGGFALAIEKLFKAPSEGKSIIKGQTSP